MRNKSDEKIIQGIIEFKELPAKQLMEISIDLLLRQKDWRERASTEHRERLEKIVPLEYPDKELIKLLFLHARENTLKDEYSRTKTIEVPDWVQVTPEGVMALDHLLHFLNFFDQNGILETFYSLNSAMNSVYANESKKESQSIMEVLEWLRIFLWECLSPPVAKV